MGDTHLAGVKFWVTGGPGARWKDGTTEWAAVTFPSGTSEAQMTVVVNTLSHMFPVDMKSDDLSM